MKFAEKESSILEFKREVPKNEQIIKTIIGFCNHNGGRLIIGIDDDGTIVGIDENHAQEVLEYVEKSIYQASAPPIIPRVYTQLFGNKTVIVIEVSAGMNKPYFVVAEGLEKGTYVRLGRSTLRANADSIEELKWQSRGKSYDTMPVYHASVTDLDEEKIKEFLAARTKKRASKVTKEILRSYFLAVEEHAHWYPTIAGILLFGKEPQHFVSEAMIICTYFSGTHGREVIASKDCVGNLPEQIDAAIDFVAGHLHTSFRIKEIRRSEKSELPLEAIREAILNAIVHRNYYLKAPCKIALYQDRLEIFSPGNFPGPLNQDNLLQGISYLRNIALCKVLREMGYVEKLGSGFITMFESYARWGLERPQVIEGENYVKCILPRQRALAQKNATQGEKIVTEAQRIVALLSRVGEISIADVIENLHIPRATAGKKLAYLVQQKQLVKYGKGRGTKYRKD